MQHKMFVIKAHGGFYNPQEHNSKPILSIDYKISELGFNSQEAYLVHEIQQDNEVFMYEIGSN